MAQEHIAAAHAALTPRHVADVAALLADAFEVDSAYRYLFPDPQLRRAGLSDFFARNLRTHLAHRCTQVAVDAGGHVLGTLTLISEKTLQPPDGAPYTVWSIRRD